MTLAKLFCDVKISTEEVYHSLDEAIEADFRNNSSKYYYRKSEYQKIIKQKHMKIDLDEKDMILKIEMKQFQILWLDKTVLSVNVGTNIYNI